jgi:AcrR family transcriptional regulator
MMNVVHERCENNLDYRQKIMEAGAVEFQAKGFNKADMRSIATKASIAVGTIYNYFPDKTSLFSAIVMEHWQKVQAIIKDIAESDLPLREKLLRIGTIHLKFTSEHRAMFREIAMSPLESASSGPQKGHLNILKPYLDQLTEIIKQDFEPRLDAPSAQRLATVFFSSLAFLPSFLPGEDRENLEFITKVILQYQHE